MYNSLLVRIFTFTFGLLFTLCPISVQASQMDKMSRELEPGVKYEDPDQMTQKQMNDLFGDDPYLGQTSYLQSPDSFSQREK